MNYGFAERYRLFELIQINGCRLAVVYPVDRAEALEECRRHSDFSIAIMSTTSGESILRKIERLKQRGDANSTVKKIDLLDRLSRLQLSRAAQVFRLHEILCFLRAYPDDVRLLTLVEAMLAAFHERRDLVRFRRALADTGIAGTAIHFRFFWPTARWLVRRYPGLVEIDWQELENEREIEGMLELSLPGFESIMIESGVLSLKELLGVLKGADETDAEFLIRRFGAFHADDSIREKLYDDLDVPLRIEPSPLAPSRTRSKLGTAAICYSTRPGPERPSDVRSAIRQLRFTVGPVIGRQARALTDLGRIQMITRGRDLYAFMHTNQNDVRVIDCSDGLQFVCYGLEPDKRLLLETLYIFLILHNGVPVGYTQASNLYRSSEVNFNVFETFRGVDTSRIFTATLAMMRHLFDVDAFIINTQQLGEDNAEALKTGAWWFYVKHGFRPTDPEIKRIAEPELRAKRRDPGHRTDMRTLKKLAADNLYLFLGRPRRVTVSTLDSENIGLAVSRYLARRFGSEREKSMRRCAEEAGALLGVRGRKDWPRDERRAWERWSPLLLLMTGVEGWRSAEKRALVEVVRAKGGRQESEFLSRFEAHPRLRAGLARIAARC